MSVESQIFDTLKVLVSNRVFPDVANGSVLPYITYQQVGGQSVNFVDPTIPSKTNSRFQINVWADTRSQVSSIAKSVEDALRTSSLQTTVLSQPVSIFEEETGLKGSRQDFSFWS